MRLSLLKFVDVTAASVTRAVPRFGINLHQVLQGEAGVEARQANMILNPQNM